LTLVDGGYTASFTVGGATATRYRVMSDGHGGTLITAVAVQPATLAQHMAAFAVGAPPAARDPISSGSAASSMFAAGGGRTG